MLRPFGKKFKNNGDGGRESSCCLCGKEIKGQVRYSVEVVNGGYDFVRSTDDPDRVAGLRLDQSSYMGWFPVGPDCRDTLHRDKVIVYHT